jgi:hypothetical protein
MEQYKLIEKLENTKNIFELKRIIEPLGIQIRSLIDDHELWTMLVSLHMGLTYFPNTVQTPYEFYKRAWAKH